MTDAPPRTSAKGLAGMFVVLAFSTVVARGLMFAANVLVARRLGVDPFGAFRFYNTIVFYLLLLANLGFDVYLLRMCARDEMRVKGALGMQLRWRGVTAMCLFVITGAAAMFLLPWPNNLLLITLSLRVLVFVFNIEWLVRLRDNIKLLAALPVLSGGAVLLGAVAFVRTDKDIITLAVVFVVAELAVVALQWLAEGEETTKASVHEEAEHVKTSIIVSLSGFMISIYYNTDAFMLGIFRNAHDVGIYSAAYTLLLAATAPAAVLYQVFAPSLSKAGLERPLIRRYVRDCAIVGTLCLAGTIILHKPLILMLYGRQYAESVPVLLWLSLDILPCFLAGAFTIPINLSGAHKAYLAIVATGTVTNVVGNFIFIPRYGIYAAIATTIASEVLVMACGAWYLYRHFRSKPRGE